MSAASMIILVLVILLMMVRRQLTPRPLTVRLLYVPLILLFLAVYQAGDFPKLGMLNWVSFIVSLALGLVAGLVAGNFTKVFEQNGQWMVVGSLLTLGIWVLSVPFRFGVRLVMNVLFHVPALPQKAEFIPYLFSIAGILLGQILMVLFKNPSHVGTIFTQERRPRRSL